MNGAEKIKDRILADARDLCNKILEDARHEAQSIIGNAEKEAFKKVTVMTEKAKEETIQIKQRFNAVSGLEDRKNALKARQDSVDEAFDAALARLAALPEDQYVQLLEEILVDVARDEAGTLVLNERDKGRLGQSFVSQMNDKLAKAGKKAKLSLSEDVLKSRGGFVIRYGDMELNCTLEVLMTLARPVLEPEVAAILLRQ